MHVREIVSLMGEELPADIVTTLHESNLYDFVVAEIQRLTALDEEDDQYSIAIDTLDAVARMVRRPSITEAEDTVDDLIHYIMYFEAIYLEGFAQDMASEYRARNLFFNDLIALSREVNTMALAYKDQRIEAELANGTLDPSEVYGSADEMDMDDEFVGDDEDEPEYPCARNGYLLTLKD